jgi:hypothetical protein
MMHRSNFTRYLLGVFAASVAVSAAPFRIAGYLPDYRAATFDVEAARGLTDLFLFSAEPTATGQLEISRLEPFPWKVFRQGPCRGSHPFHE